MNLPQPFAPKGRAERMIAGARLVLAACSLLALSIEPSLPARFALPTRALTIGYTVWAVGLALLLALQSTWLFRHWQLFTHAVDLLVALAFMSLTAGPDSPFFFYLLFALMAATLRWDARGAVWTGAAVLLTYAGTVVMDWRRGNPLEVNVTVMRSAYLSVLALMLAYLGRYVAHVRGVTDSLRMWQPAVNGGIGAVTGEAVRYVGDVLRAPRVVFAWEEPEEPDLRLTCLVDGQVSTLREETAAFQPLVSAAFDGTDFFCRDMSTANAVVVFASPDGFQSASGPAVHERFVTRFTIRTLLAVRCGPGWLFVIDKPQLDIDDLWLAQIVSRQVASSLEQVSLADRLEEARVSEARGRVARDLHDGLLQSLTAIMLRVASIGRAVDSETRGRLESVQGMISEEARRLREFIQYLTSVAPTPVVDSLTDRLETLRQSIERDWNLRTHLSLEDVARVPARLSDDVYFIVREALINAARHAAASAASATVAVVRDRLSITVHDDGRGFPFEGRRDGATLASTNLVPRMLYRRATSLGGHLTIDSGPRGARLDIEVPLSEGGA
jgi:signal transduction histidine kinase